MEVGALTLGFGGNLFGYSKSPAFAHGGIGKWAWLIGIPLVLRAVVKNRFVEKVAEGGFVAAMVHAVNEWAPDPIKGQLVPAFLMPEGAYFGFGPTATSGLGSYPSTVRGLGAGESDLDYAEMDRILMSGMGSYPATQDGLGYAAYERLSGFGVADEEMFRVV